MITDLNKLIKDNIAKNTKVVLAFSGGPDSVYLLYRLLELDHFKIVIAHLNHKLRGKDSDLDEEFSKNIAKKHNLLYESVSFDIKKYAKENSLNIEEAARIKRYEFLRSIKEKHDAKYILTAHHADDNLETFLLNFLRGSGLNGLKSMQFINKDLVRPLLYTSKEKILQYLTKNKIEYRIDKSNSDTSLKRNKLRHEVIPKLKELQPDLINVSCRNLENISEIHSFINNKAEDNALTKEILTNLYKNLYGSTKNFTSSQIDKLLNLIKETKTGKKVEFGKDFYLTATSNSVEIIPKNQNSQISKKRLEIPGTTKYEFGEIECKLHKTPPKKGIYFDYSKTDSPLFVRGKISGDRFNPFGLKGTKKLQDYFTDKKIPQHKRSEIPIITTGKGKIVAVGDMTIDDNYKISESNNKKGNEYLEILIKKAKL